MKFIHFADCHLDCLLKDLGEKANSRRKEIRDTFLNALDIGKRNNVDVVFISGDLFEHNYVENSTMKIISKKMEEISPIKIFISPGNHDPFIKNSYYNNHLWPENVYIFKEFEKLYIEELNTTIYGNGFNDFYMNSCNIPQIKLDNSINVLVTHGEIVANSKYHPISKNILLSNKFDYCALGHIHKTDIDAKTMICYPGSLEPLGFDELGEHGIIIGEITKEYKNINFYSMAKRKYCIEEINVDKMYTNEQIIDNIKLIINFEFARKNIYKIKLIGFKNHEFNVNIDIIQEGLKNYSYHIIIEDNTQSDYNIESLQNEYSLKGIFVKRMNEIMKNTEEKDKDKIKEALIYGIKALNNEKIDI